MRRVEAPAELAGNCHGIDAIWFWCHIFGVPTVVSGDFEWNDAKAASNLAKHGVSFDEAATALVDPAAVFLDDGEHPDRVIAIGMFAAAPRPLRRPRRAWTSRAHHQRPLRHCTGRVPLQRRTMKP